MGGATGFILPTFFVDGKDTKTEFKGGIYNMVTVSAIACATLLLLTFVLFKAKPGSKTREIQWNINLEEEDRNEHSEVEDLGVKDTFKELFKNTNLLVLSAISGIL